MLLPYLWLGTNGLTFSFNTGECGHSWTKLHNYCSTAMAVFTNHRVQECEKSQATRP